MRLKLTRNLQTLQYYL